MIPDYLIKKYNVPAPRYTSYPTVPYWDTQVPEAAEWLEVVKRTFVASNASKGISVYIHLPFCESLCTYCGCNTRITRNHSVEASYIQAVLDEWKIYLQQFPEKPIIRELHLGGGTPTFFDPQNLRALIDVLLADATVHPNREFSFEGHPNNTTYEHLRVLHELGFRRVSFGIQDFDERVQRIINRIQPFVNVERVTRQAREIGYESVNFDLVYGLPLQTPDSVADTLEKVALLKPDRIAFYSYAHVPWLKPGQRQYTEQDLPDQEQKRHLYDLGLQKFTEWGYAEIGMDHFALPSDTLSKAAHDKTLHRNFMGYTTCHTDLLIGLGASSISDAKGAYLQNQKTVEGYKQALAAGELPILKGHFLTTEDSLVRECILTLICRGELVLTDAVSGSQTRETCRQLADMIQEGLLEIDRDVLTITELGKAFIRNICLVFDRKYHQAQLPKKQVFSRAI
jgi:oxygen-independent coproporphyrinogen-3 oxidase